MNILWQYTVKNHRQEEQSMIIVRSWFEAEVLLHWTNDHLNPFCQIIDIQLSQLKCKLKI